MKIAMMVKNVYFLLFFILYFSNGLLATGTWKKINSTPPNYNLGVMLLLSDGTVISVSSINSNDSVSAGWLRLTPDKYGSYINGSWSKISPMNYSRLYFSSQTLTDGRVYIAGGEYGTGDSIG